MTEKERLTNLNQIMESNHGPNFNISKQAEAAIEEVEKRRKKIVLESILAVRRKKKW